MSVKRICMVGWLLVLLLLLPTAAAARAALFPAEQALALAEQSTVTADYLQYPRGSITDRCGRAFTDVLCPSLLLFPVQLGAEAPQLARLLGCSSEQLQQDIAGQQMLVWQRGLDEAQAAAVAAAALPGVQLAELPQRQSQLAAWLIGSAEPLSGLEQQYDGWLQGGDSGEIVANIDARGNYCGNGLFYVAGSGGNTLQLTLDIDYQQLAEQVLAENRGALVLLDAADGAVLAWAAADEAAAMALHSAQQLQPLIEHWQAAAGQKLSFAVLPLGYSAEVAAGEGLSVLQAAQLAALTFSGSCVTPYLLRGICDEQGAEVLASAAVAPQPQLGAALSSAHAALLSGAAAAEGSWYIAQLAGEQQVVAALWLDGGTAGQAERLGAALLQRLRDLENW